MNGAPGTLWFLLLRSVTFLLLRPSPGFLLSPSAGFHPPSLLVSSLAALHLGVMAGADGLRGEEELKVKQQPKRSSLYL